MTDDSSTFEGVTRLKRDTYQTFVSSFHSQELLQGSDEAHECDMCTCFFKPEKKPEKSDYLCFFGENTFFSDIGFRDHDLRFLIFCS